MRWLVIALVACKTKEAPVVEPKPVGNVAIDAAIDAMVADAPSGPPADFPARGAPPVTGQLASRPFTVAKAFVRTQPEQTTLDLYGWREGGPCEPQLAAEPHQLYVSVSLPTSRFVAGAPITSTDERVVVTYKKPDLGAAHETSWTVFDEITADRVRGRILMTSPDGSRVAGSFEATVCVSPQQARAAPAPVHGLAWGTRDVDPKTLPKQPVTGALLGTVAAPVAVEVIDWVGEGVGPHELHFYVTPPAAPCQTTQVTPGFVVGFGGTQIERGATLRDAVTTSTRAPYAQVIWQEPGKVMGVVERGWVSAIIDRSTRTRVEGRVFAWFEDPAKSMVAGAFAATVCPVK